MTLRNGVIGMTYAISSINENKLDQITVNRLKVLGLIRGTKIIIINKNRSGSVIFKVRGSRLAVGKKIASCVHIKEVIS